MDTSPMSAPSASAFSFRSPVLAVAVGLVVFAIGSLLRAAAQPYLGSAHFLGAILTLAVFLIPGILTGAWSPRHTLLHGLILGILAGGFLTLQMGHFSHLDWSTRPTLRTLGVLAGLGIILCELGALAGRAWALRARSRKDR